MKRMLINATQPEEIRVAMVDGQELYNLDIESINHVGNKANIYKARIEHVEQSLEAAFVDYGGNRHGFLPLKEISHSLFKTPPAPNDLERINIKDIIHEGQEIIVQIEKEERHNKGAALTTIISLAGRYMVFIPNEEGSVGISRKIEGHERAEAREMMNQLNVPEDTTLILRTAGIGKSQKELQWDTNYLTNLWLAIKQAASERPAPFLIYEESKVINRTIRDYVRTDIEEIWIDDKDSYQQSLEFMKKVMPHSIQKLHLYEEADPLFTRYQIENQINSAFSRNISLPSGGSLIIDRTEALTSIDINSSRATKGQGIEETAFSTNLEASIEIAKQLRLRDLGGLIVIDFIDMRNKKSQREVEQQMKSAIRLDRAKIRVGEISRFGLLEMSRQRLRPSLGESQYFPCPRCDGQGHIRDVESISLAILRIIEEEAVKDSMAKIITNLPVSVATFLLNEKRQSINDLQQRFGIEIVIVPSATMQTPQYKVQKIKLSEVDLPRYKKVSYAMMNDTYYTEEEPARDLHVDKKLAEQPAIKQIIPGSLIQSRSKTKPKKGLIALAFQWLANFFSRNDDKTKVAKTRYHQGSRTKSQNENDQQRPTARRNQRSSNNARYDRNRNNKSRSNRSTHRAYEGSAVKKKESSQKAHPRNTMNSHKENNTSSTRHSNKRVDKQPLQHAKQPQGQGQGQGEPQGQPLRNDNNLFQEDIFPTKSHLSNSIPPVKTSSEKID